MAKVIRFPKNHVFTPEEQALRDMAIKGRHQKIIESRNAEQALVRQHFAVAEKNSFAAIERQQAMLDATASWGALKYWKRARWSVCAAAQFALKYPDVANGAWSGFALYLKMWQDQKTEPGKQPISPCSRRATDSNASPFDFTP